jgi:ADP-ribose pyrophosphatase
MRRFAQPPSGPIADRPADVTVSAPELIGKGFRPYNRFRFAFAGRGGEPQTRDILCTGASAAVLPLDLARDEIVLLQQFRLAAQLANGHGELFEIVAGHVEANESARQTAHRECIEEIGCAPEPLIELFRYMPTPGLSDEQMTLFLGGVDGSTIPERAGAAAEHEETFPVRVPIATALAALASGQMRSGPLLMALQWLSLNRPRLGEIVRTGTVRPR